jgi:hypothetical protein
MPKKFEALCKNQAQNKKQNKKTITTKNRGKRTQKNLKHKDLIVRAIA